MICQPCSRQCPKCGLGWQPVRLSYRLLHVNPHTNYPLKVTKGHILFTMFISSLLSAQFFITWIYRVRSTFLHLLSQTSSILWLFGTSCHSFRFLMHFFVLVSIPIARKWPDLSCSDNTLIVNLAKHSDDWRMPLWPYNIGHNSVVCCD